MNNSKLSCKRGFGIMEVMIAAAVLGFLYMAVLNLQKGNHEALLRIRGRDGAIEVATQIIDSLQAVGMSALPSKEIKDSVFTLDTVKRSWERGLGGVSTISYVPTITVYPTDDAAYEIGDITTAVVYKTSQASKFETVNHTYAKLINVQIEWDFKGSTQSINVSGVVR